MQFLGSIQFNHTIFGHTVFTGARFEAKTKFYHVVFGGGEKTFSMMNYTRMIYQKFLL